MRCSSFCAIFAIIALSCGRLAAEDGLRFENICDISAAVHLGDGHILAASDEENTLYSFPADGGAPVARQALNPLFGGAPITSEIDIEAAAKGTDIIWWVGSHQPFKSSRQMVFATNIPTPDLTDLRIVKTPVNLTGILRNSDLAAGLWHPMAFLEEPEFGGLNIEAAAVAEDGHLLIGLRAPLGGSDGLSGPAFVISLDMTSPVSVTEVYPLDLADRGIRGMAASGAGFLIIAGHLAGHGNSDLFYWRPGTRPTLLADLELPHLNPESVVTTPERMILMSDDSSVPRRAGDGSISRCKTLQQQTTQDRGASVFAQGIEITR